MSTQRTNSIVAVTIAKYACVYVEADSPEKAIEIVKENLDEIYDARSSDIDGDFEGSEIAVDSCEAYTTTIEDFMDWIWADGEDLDYEEYLDEMEQDKE